MDEVALAYLFFSPPFLNVTPLDYKDIMLIRSKVYDKDFHSIQSHLNCFCLFQGLLSPSAITSVQLSLI